MTAAAPLPAGETTVFRVVVYVERYDEVDGERKRTLIINREKRGISPESVVDKARDLAVEAAHKALEGWK